MKNARRPLLWVLLATPLLLGGCATHDPNRAAKTGAAIGAIAGAVTGHQLDRSSGRYVGAVVGAMTGAAVGNYMDKQQQAFNQALAEEQRRNQMQVERLADDTLRLSLDSEVSFDFDRHTIKPAFHNSLDRLAEVLVRYDRTIVHIVGHTDSIGSEAYNQRLSEQRALRVRDYLWRQGVDPERMVAEGRGELEPRDTNATEAGRQLNRRVEIYVKPIIEGREREAYQSPRYR